MSPYSRNEASSAFDFCPKSSLHQHSTWQHSSVACIVLATLDAVGLDRSPLNMRRSRQTAESDWLLLQPCIMAETVASLTSSDRPSTKQDSFSDLIHDTKRE